MRHIKFVIIENLFKGYEQGRWTDLAFIYLVIQAIVGHKEEDDIEY